MTKTEICNDVLKTIIGLMCAAVIFISGMLIERNHIHNEAIEHGFGERVNDVFQWRDGHAASQEYLKTTDAPKWKPDVAPNIKIDDIPMPEDEQESPSPPKPEEIPEIDAPQFPRVLSPVERMS